MKGGRLAVAGLLLASCAAPDDHFERFQGAVVRGARTRRELALIFTGGAQGEGSGPILECLARRGVRASFFVTGDYLADPAHRPHLARMLADGHYLGPHSHAHLLYCAWEERERSLVDRETFRRDLARNIEELRALGACPPGEPIFFIPPYEWYNAEQVAWAREMGVTLFNFTPGSGSNRDWAPEGHASFAPSEEILADILAYERRDPHGLNGFLLLLHLGSTRRDKMHPLLDALLEELERRGYRFLRIDELLGEDSSRKEVPCRPAFSPVPQSSP